MITMIQWRGDDFVGSFVVESAKNELFLYYLVQGIKAASGRLTQVAEGSEDLIREEGFDQIINTQSEGFSIHTLGADRAII